MTTLINKLMMAKSEIQVKGIVVDFVRKATIDDISKLINQLQPAKNMKPVKYAIERLNQAKGRLLAPKIMKGTNAQDRNFSARQKEWANKNGKGRAELNPAK